MGIVKSAFKICCEIITCGGASRLEDAKEAYKEVYDRYEALYKSADEYKSKIDVAVSSIGKSLEDAKVYLNRSEVLVQSQLRKNDDVKFLFNNEILKKANKFNSGFNAAIGVSAGSVAGGSLAVGTWGLVTVFGAASTGTAISTLSGVAATNATLAWFGGGALAAGGAGMAGGAAVLGGLFAIPLFYFAAKGTHKKAEEFEEETIKLEDAIVQIQEKIKILEQSLVVIEEKQRVISLLCYEFISEVIVCTTVIRPYGILSAIFQRFLSFIGNNSYNPEQVDALDRLTHSIEKFLTNLGICEKTV
jgi:hypothetical protein